VPFFFSSAPLLLLLLLLQVLDVGCGIGGPLRGVVRATGANVTGLTINRAQVARAQEITKTLSPWMQARCHFEVQDYLNIKVLYGECIREHQET